MSTIRNDKKAKTMTMNKGKSVGDSILEGLKEFSAALENGRPVSEQLTCRRVVLNLVPAQYGPKEVKEIRKLLGASQAVFARFIGVSPNTVRAWEQGTNPPSDIASRFMYEIRHDPDYWQNRLSEVTTSKTPA